MLFKINMKKSFISDVQEEKRVFINIFLLYLQIILIFQVYII